MPEGTVKWFNPRKKEGVIAPDDRSGDVFVDYSALGIIPIILRKGMKVTYTFNVSPSGERRAEFVIDARRKPALGWRLNGRNFKLHERLLKFGYGKGPEWFAKREAIAVARPYRVRQIRFGRDGLLIALGSPSSRQEADPELTQAVGDVQRVDSYLDTQDEAVADKVFEAIDQVVLAMGFSAPTTEEIQHGSFFRRAAAKAQQAANSAVIQETLAKAQRALELEYIGLKQAEVDQMTAEAVGNLIASLREVPEACIRLPGILLIKYQGAHGPVLMTRTLTPAEIHALNRYPEIQTSPSRALDALATAVAAILPAPNVPPNP